MRTVYLDMDGVLADFDSKFFEIVGKRKHEFPTKQEGWDALGKHKWDLYLNLPKMPDANTLVTGVMLLCASFGAKPAVLTAVPKIGNIPLAKPHKKQWLFWNFIELLEDFNIGPLAEHKQFHCVGNDVLIDDKLRNIEQWIAKGGVGIHHTSATQTLIELEKALAN